MKFFVVFVVFVAAFFLSGVDARFRKGDWGSGVFTYNKKAELDRWRGTPDDASATLSPEEQDNSNGDDASAPAENDNFNEDDDDASAVRKPAPKKGASRTPAKSNPAKPAAAPPKASGGVRYIVPNPTKYIGKLIGTGECVSFPQTILGMPRTASWKMGPRADQLGNIPVGAVLASGWVNGKYTSKSSGNHVVIFISKQGSSIRVLDQWAKRSNRPNRPVNYSTYPASRYFAVQ